MTKLIGAADIGGMTTKLGLFDEKLKLLKAWSIPTDISDNGAGILPELCKSLKAELRPFCEVKLSGIGIAVPAAVDEQAVARNCTNIGWGTVDLRAELHRLMPEVDKVAFGNDATVAALGELKLGAARTYTSAYLITLGTGVGGGYACDGKVVSGAHGAAGEIGHMLINPHESSGCMCGRRGCLEQYASAAGIVRLARNILYLQNTDESDTENASKYNPYTDCMTKSPDTKSRYKLSAKPDSDTDSDRVHIERLFKPDIPKEHSILKTMEQFDAKDICDAARAGDKLSIYILKVFGECMGLAMSSISCTIDPECFIIGGGMSKAGDIVLDTIRRGFARYAYPASAATPVIQAELGNMAGIYGCAAMVKKGFGK